MPAAKVCCRCGSEPLENARFCHGCGSPLVDVDRHAEYKQVTVLFADVVHSMDIAAAVGAERLREIMAELADRCAAVVQHFGGTVDKFTGDGIMAVFGAPVALEDHALRACLAALDIQKEAELVAARVDRRDGITLQVRVGLNSGQVIAGDIGSGPFGYTAVGEQVGMAQRMESVASPGGVMLSESTARLVEGAVVLGGPEIVHIKGVSAPVPARRLVAVADHPKIAIRRRESTFVGRQWEMAALGGILDHVISGHGCVLRVVGPAGIGKSRLVREIAALATGRGVDVYSVFCESHASDIAFHVVARLLRAVTGVDGLDGQVARDRVRAHASDAAAEDLLLFDDLLGISDPAVALPRIDPDARRRRLTALVNAASLARTRPAVYVIEDAQWIDEVSESMLADFLTVIPQTPSMVLITYRPEYQGALARVPDAQMIALAPLSDSETSELIAELLGPDASVAGLVATIAGQAGGNPFFAEEMVRDLAERGVLDGHRGAYALRGEPVEVSIPATLQATIEARIDRLGAGAKRTLNAAAVIGSRFTTDLLTVLGVNPVLDELVKAELIDQVRFTPCAEYAFRHPLIRTVAYESQLRSDRAELHRRLAAAIEQHDPDSADNNAALIAEHLAAAGDLHGAFGWHMRAGGWSTYRDINAARMDWQLACQIADRLPLDDPNRLGMRIAPRTLLCAHAWHIGGSFPDSEFAELRELTGAAGDKVSLAIGMAGLLPALSFNDRIAESAQLATECATLIEAIGDPALTVGLFPGPMEAKFEHGEVVETLRLADRVIDLAHGDATMGNVAVGSPLAMALCYRGCAEISLGRRGFREHCDEAIAIARPVDPTCFAVVILWKYDHIAAGVFLADDAALRDTADALAIAEQSGDDFAFASALLVRGITLVYGDGPDSDAGYDLLAKARDMALAHRFNLNAVPFVDVHSAMRKLQTTDVDGAIDVARVAIDNLFASGGMIWRGLATTVLVESLLRRGTDADIVEAHAAIDRLAAVPTDPGFVMYEVPLLRMRALLARAHGDEAAYRDFRDRYRAMATALGFDGHMKWAEAMP